MTTVTTVRMVTKVTTVTTVTTVSTVTTVTTVTTVRMVTKVTTVTTVTTVTRVATVTTVTTVTLVTTVKTVTTVSTVRTVTTVTMVKKVTMVKTGTTKSLPDSFRGEILDLYNYRGFSKKQISQDLQVTTRAVRKIIRHFQRYGTLTAFSHGGSEPRKVTDNVLQCMEIWKLQKPTTYAHEIRNRLYLEGICDGSTLPPESSILRT